MNLSLQTSHRTEELRVQFKLQLIVIDGDKSDVREIATLDKKTDRIEDVGLTLTESKDVLRELQIDTSEMNGDLGEHESL